MIVEQNIDRMQAVRQSHWGRRMDAGPVTLCPIVYDG